MSKQTNYIFFSFFFLLISLVLIQQYDHLNSVQAAILVPIIIFLIIFSDIIILLSKDPKTSLWFGGILFLIAFYMVATLLPFPIVWPIASSAISFLPYLMFRFFMLFNRIPIAALSQKIDYFLRSLALVSTILLITSLSTFYWIIPVEIFISIGSCSLVYSKAKDHLSAATRKEQRILANSLVFAFAPFVLAFTIFINYLPGTLKLYSLVFILIVPITVGILLVRRKETRIDNYTILITAFTAIEGVIILLGINHFFLNLSKKKLLFLLILCLFLLYLVYFRHLYLNKIQVQRIQQSKNAFQKEKIQLTQRITKEEFLSSISTLISNLLLQIHSIDSHLVVWNEGEQPYILSNTGIFSKVTLTNDLLEQMKTNSSFIHFNHSDFLMFPLNSENKFLGWFIIGNKSEEKLTAIDYEIMQELAFSIGEIILINEQIYNTKHETFFIDSLKYDDYVHYEYLNMVQNFQKEFTIFIHDNILQDFLALKKLTESLKTEQLETKKLILETYNSLNRTFRDKMFELYPSTIEEAPLSQSIENLCTKFNADYPNVSISFYCPVEIDLQKELKFHSYRIVQELLTNALKHSEAQKITISLIQIGSHIRSIIQDDGIGFDFNQIKTNRLDHQHFGLLSINQEINSLNGELQIFSSKPQGTKIVVTLPIPKEN
ncbi:sensor histidine kinase [Enterococcus sp. CWB-B31]|uniref:sensor histidine kinase n=1 Tax=Enterococcus sp. CWB-B31 TaxID=2885159 RepID=UPI001E3DAC7E|nr:ATP-binding protein [Enterococcus sp. CWB-B31]MCB5954597.1 ATP-binding protein [Enterococcus sp. CWB-B31]